MSQLLGKIVRLSVIESLGTVPATVGSIKDGSATVSFSKYGSVYQAIVPLAWVRSKVSGKTSTAVDIKAGAKVLVSMQVDAVARRTGTVVGETDTYILLQPEAASAEVKIIPWHRIKDAVVSNKAAAATDVVKAPRLAAPAAPAALSAPRKAAPAAPSAPARKPR